MTSTMMNTSIHNIPPTYASTDVLNRHQYAVQKVRKPASTGGGRAWSEEEEVYLLQTRLQKMPYKHIAAHLKKTELACRLHYHQLSHGSNRRKRTASISSTSSHSPEMHFSNAPSPINESTSSPGSPEPYSYSPSSNHVHLPSAASLLLQSSSTSPQHMTLHPVAILPKPSLPRQMSATPPLRLDCAVQVPSHGPIPIDYNRLNYIYESHRAALWGAIAAEYGNGVSAIALEEAWRYGPSNGNGNSLPTHGPPTPCTSPGGGTAYLRKEKVAPVESRPRGTSISALLGINASPTSPEERELIKRIEEGRAEIV